MNYFGPDSRYRPEMVNTPLGRISGPQALFNAGAAKWQERQAMERPANEQAVHASHPNPAAQPRLPVQTAVADPMDPRLREDYLNSNNGSEQAQSAMLRDSLGVAGLRQYMTQQQAAQRDAARLGMVRSTNLIS
jgi:hypothetical protein